MRDARISDPACGKAPQLFRPGRVQLPDPAAHRTDILTKFVLPSELTLPKALQILREDPEIYQCADQILEASDWLTFLLTGSRRRTGSTAGYKAMWLEGEGYPDRAFLKALDKRADELQMPAENRAAYRPGRSEERWTR